MARTPRSSRCVISSWCCNANSARREHGSPRATGRSWPRCCTVSRAACCAGCGCWCARTRYCAGTPRPGRASARGLFPAQGPATAPHRPLRPCPGAAPGPGESHLGLPESARRTARAGDRGGRFHGTRGEQPCTGRPWSGPPLGDRSPTPDDHLHRFTQSERNGSSEAFRKKCASGTPRDRIVERPSNSQTAAAATVALRPIPLLAIQAGGTVAASTAAHHAELTALARRARKAAAGAEQAPRSTHCGCEPTPQTAAAQRTDADALTRGRFGPRGTGRRAGAVGSPGAASLPCRPIQPECMPRTARPSDAAVQHHGRRRRGCTPWRGDH